MRNLMTGGTPPVASHLSHQNNMGRDPFDSAQGKLLVPPSIKTPRRSFASSPVRIRDSISR